MNSTNLHSRTSRRLGGAFLASTMALGALVAGATAAQAASQPKTTKSAQHNGNGSQGKSSDSKSKSGGSKSKSGGSKSKSSPSHHKSTGSKSKGSGSKGKSSSSKHAIPFTAATVTKNSNGSYTISWAATGLHGVTVYAGHTQQSVDLRHPVAHGKSTDSVTVSGLGTADRMWFHLAPSSGEGLTLADRSLHLASAPNFRDVGGYRTSDGSWVKMGVAYRSGDLSTLSDADLAELHRLGITTIYDLRTDAEIAAKPDRVPVGAKDIQENVTGTSSTGALPTSADAAFALMVSGEVGMVDGASAQQSYNAVLSGIADAGHGAVVFHCTAGKDRTGWGDAALLTALGVPKQTVTADYLLSNDFNAASNAATLAALPPATAAIYKPLLAVDPAYLNAGFTEVQAQYRSFANYLDKGLGLDTHTLNKLKSQLLVG